MGLFSSTQPSIRARVLPRFPAQVLAGNGITIEKTGGKYIFSASTGAQISLDAGTSLSTVPLLTGIAKTLVALTLSPGDWEVNGVAYFTPSATSVVNSLTASLSLVNDTLDISVGKFVKGTFPGAVAWGAGNFTSQAIPGTRFTVGITTPVFLVGSAQFAPATLTAGAAIHARRLG